MASKELELVQRMEKKKHGQNYVKHLKSMKRMTKGF